jgi:glycosyltransferase involved in cell wall biosynthesis
MHRRYGVDPAVVMNCPETSNMPSENGTLLAPYRRPDELLLVYAGGFTPNRGLDNVIDAATAVDGVRLVMIGWGPLEHTLRTRSASDRVVFAEAVDPDELIGVLTGADIGIAPYVPVGLNNFLAAPNKVFEYLHAGLAIAASDLPDIRKIVEAHDVGELFDASDVTSIARALRALVADPQRLEAAKRNARAAAGLYTWDAQAAVLLDVYARIKQ